MIRRSDIRTSSVWVTAACPSDGSPGIVSYGGHRYHSRLFKKAKAYGRRLEKSDCHGRTPKPPSQEHEVIRALDRKIRVLEITSLESDI